MQLRNENRIGNDELCYILKKPPSSLGLRATCVIRLSGSSAISRVFLKVMVKIMVEIGETTLTLLLGRSELCSFTVDDDDIWAGSHWSHGDNRLARRHSLQLVLYGNGIDILQRRLVSFWTRCRWVGKDLRMACQ